ncbi:mobilisation protein [Streptococcus dysgalactiae]|nr:mobilisation protein [Streptococcus dysgalactiae]
MEQKRRTRVNRFELRTTDKEADNLRHRITLAGKKTFQAYALKMLLHGKIETYDYSELRQLRIEVNRIGQNVNQLVRYVNTFEELDNDLLEALQDDIKEVKQLITNEFKRKEYAKQNGSHKSNPIKSSKNLKRAINYIARDDATLIKGNGNLADEDYSYEVVNGQVMKRLVSGHDLTDISDTDMIYEDFMLLKQSVDAFI